MGENNRYMWLLVFFDLPVKAKKQRREASRFRQSLLRDGYIMLQYSVYARICNNPEKADTHIRRMKCFMPCEGCVRALLVTERQFGRMSILLGQPHPQLDGPIGKPTQLLLF